MNINSIAKGFECIVDVFGFSRNPYRFGFNGYEKDDEMKGAGNWYSYGDYGYDSRIVQRPSPDPMTAKFPNFSPYAAFGNNPILFVDTDGEIFRIYYEIKNAETGKTTLTYIDFNGTQAITENGAAYSTGVNQFVDDVISSYNYIVGNGADAVGVDAEGVLQNLASRSEITNVKYTTVKDGTEYNPKTSTINYNPLSGLDIKNSENEGIQSPAIGFLHDASHRYIELKYTDEQKKDLEKAGSGGVLKEDLEIMDKFETPAVKILQGKGKNEAFRISYGWDSIETWTSSPTSTIPIKNKEAKESLENRNITIE